MARILIVDDEQDIVDIVGRALRRRDHMVIVAQNGQEAIAMLQQQRPDLIILDILLPHINGIQICRYIRTSPTLASIPILFLTIKEKIEDKIAGFEAGADDYLTKPFNLNELELRVKALLRHTGYMAPTGPLSAGPISVDPSTGDVRIKEESVQLTSVEFELLYFLMAHTGEVLSTERLLQEVWGYPPGSGNASLVRMHMLNLRRKIEPDPQHPIYLCTVPRHGYVLSSTSARASS